jgi:hypothetical protein
VARSILRSLYVGCACRRPLLQYHANTAEIRKSISYGSLRVSYLRLRLPPVFQRPTALQGSVLLPHPPSKETHSKSHHHGTRTNCCPKACAPLLSAGVYGVISSDWVASRSFIYLALSLLLLVSMPCLSHAFAFRTRSSLRACHLFQFKLHRVH